MEAHQSKSRRDENAEATRLALLEAAQRLLVEVGFQAASIEEIARLARVSRGAFYHYFADKTAIFDAVVVGLQQAAVRQISDRTLALDDGWARLFEGLDAYLDLSQEPAYLRLVVIDGPGVLGPARYRQIDDAYPVGLVIATLKSLKKQGRLEVGDPELLGRMVSAMACEGAGLLAIADNPGRAKKDIMSVIRRALLPFDCRSGG